MLLLYILCTFTLFFLGDGKKLSVTSVSTANGSSTSNLFGSSAGGTLLYIKGTGFDTNPSKNSVMIGNYPCIIPGEGLKEQTMICVTSSILPILQTIPLPIVIASNREKVTASQTFVYSLSSTPQITEVYPLHASAGQSINFIGKHVITDLGDGIRPGKVKGLYIGDEPCLRIGISQKPLLGLASESIMCKVSSNQQAGRYSVREHVEVGFANKSQNLQITSMHGDPYEFVVFPTVGQVTPKNGSVAGEQMTIKGTGFPASNRDKNKIKVTVDNTDCQIVQTSSNEIRCKLKRKAATSSKIISSLNSSAPTYDSGSGFKYRRLATSQNLSVFESNEGTLAMGMMGIRESGIKGEMYSISDDSNSEVEIYEGYFYAPSTGVYRFIGYSTQEFKVYLNTYSGVPSYNKDTNLIIFGSSNKKLESPYQYESETQSKILMLQGGKYYYMKAYNKQNQVGDSFKIFVEVPNNKAELKWKAPQIQKITLNFTNQKLTFRFRSLAATSGFFTVSLKIVNPDTLAVIIDKSVTLPYNVNASTFCSTIQAFQVAYRIINNTPKCELKYLDEDLAQLPSTTLPSQIFGYEWTVSYQFPVIDPISRYPMQFPSTLFNVTYLNATTATGDDPIFTQEKLHDQVPLIEGAFKIMVNNEYLNYTTRSIDFPPSLNATELEPILKKFFKFDQINVTESDPFPGWYGKFGKSWTITYSNPPAQFPNFTFDTDKLSGGVPTTSPEVTFQSLKGFSNNLIYNPMSFELMRTFTSNPAVVVEVNKIMSVCGSSCEFTYTDGTPQISSLEMNGPYILINLTTLALKNESRIQVKIDGENACKVIEIIAQNAISCQFDTNSHGNAAFTAGSYYPQVWIHQIGFVEYVAGVAPLSFGFGLQNPTPYNGSVLGGLEVTLSGKGLPKLASDLHIEICDLKAQIKSIDPSTVTLITPAIESDFTNDTQSCLITVKFDKYNTAQVLQAGSFTYKKELVSPIITSLSKTQANPSKKGVLLIYGMGFDKNNTQDITQVKAQLIGLDNNKKYPMRILSMNDTQIKVGLSGGISGNYSVVVEIKGRGFAKYQNASMAKFQYVTKVDEIQPATGSYFGGRVVNITGSSFSREATENEVHVGNQVCATVSASENMVRCTTPSKDELTSDLEYQVNVMSRQISNSTCMGICSFTYLPIALSPFIFGISHQSINQSNIQITINGQNLENSNYQTKVVAISRISRKKYTFTPTLFNPTLVMFNSTQLPGGEYFLFVDVQEIGFSNMTILIVETILSSYNTSISTEGGFLSITGFGFPQSLEEDSFGLSIFDSSKGVQLEADVVKLNPEIIQLKLEGRGMNATLNISVSYSKSKPATQFTVNFLDTKTAKAKVISGQLTQWKGTTQILLQKLQNSILYPPLSVKAASKLSPSEEIQLEWDHNDTHIWVKNHTLQPGTYSLKIDSMTGYYQVNETITIVLPNLGQIFSFTPSNLSMEGGYIVVNHLLDQVPSSFGKHCSFFLNGQQATVERINQTSLKVNYEPFVRSDSKISDQLSTTSLESNNSKERIQELKKSKIIKNKRINLRNYVTWSDSGNTELTNKVFDDLTRTTYFSSSSNCQIGVYFGNQHLIEINRIRFYPNKTWDKPGGYLKGALFQGSSNNITWETISTLSSKVQRGWNRIVIDKKSQKAYRYFRFSHTSASACSLGSIILRGSTINEPLLTVNTTLVQESIVLSYSDGLSKFEWLTTPFQYSELETPVISTVSPQRGNVQGGEVLTLTGTSLNGIPSIIIDGKVCQVTFYNHTYINCTTSPRLQTPKQIKFDVTINGRAVILKEKFQYVYRWSNIDTWGVDLPPIEGDLIYIPPNMHLYVDESTPKLAGIIAQNSTIEIADEADIQINTANLILMGARLVAGTAQKPFLHKLNFTFYGAQTDGQIPFFGNKGIGCTNCQIQLHGSQKQAWVSGGTIVQGSNFITGPSQQPLNWKVGDEIVVAPSQFDYLEGERMTISGLNQSSLNMNLNTKEKFAFSHISYSQQTKSQNVTMWTQVGSLTRNIRLQGDENSDATQYGIHLSFIGSEDSGLEVKVSNVELRNCGQPKKERHCINFNRNLQLSTSYIKNSTAARTYAKFISVQSTSMLELSSNVGYMVKGHGIELRDGIEEKNNITNNLIIGSLPYYRGMQADVMVASYYISNPNNEIKNNVAAGSYYYGFLYDFKSNSESGIYAKDPVCPSGYSVGENSGNIVHSVRKIAVRIKDLYTRQQPCEPSRNDALSDPWSANPSQQSSFHNYLVYKNNELGLMCDDIGHVVFNNWTMVENFQNHMQFHVMNYTKERVRVSNSTFVGVTSLSNPPLNITTKALILPRSGSINLTDILFSKFISNQTIVQTCALCNDLDYYTNNGQQYFFEKVGYLSLMNTSYLKMNGLKKEIIYDLDGSFTNGKIDNLARTRATVVADLGYIVNEPGCAKINNTYAWDSVAVCNQNVTVRKVTFMNIGPETYTNYFPPIVRRVPKMTTENQTQTKILTSFSFSDVNKQIRNSWSSPFVIGSTYKIHHDFTLYHVDVQTSPLMTSTDNAIVFKFLYTSTYELFDVYKKKNLVRGSAMSSQAAVLNHSTCKNGDYFHNNSIKEFQVCASGRDLALYELIDINPVYCRFDCPKPPVIVPTPPPPQPTPTPTPTPQPVPTPPPIDINICIKETFWRKWSNATQWPGNRLPLAGQNVTVHCNWTVELDVDPAPAAQIIIDGHLIVPQTRPLINVTAESIWVRLGSWTFGNSTNHFEKPVVIQLNGRKNDTGFVIDPAYAGRKNLVVSGRLQIFGPTNFDESTYLVSPALPGSQFIYVNSTQGWKVGDQIVLSTSSRSWNQSEKLKIQEIHPMRIKVSPAIKFFHHGSALPSVNYQNNQLYTGSRVIYLSRNIKIVNGDDQSFGFSVFVYGFLDTNGNYQMGSVNLNGVEFQNGGQGSNSEPVLALKNTVMSNYSSQISKCSFNRCNGECIKLTNAKNFILEKNVMFDASRSHIRTLQIRQAKIRQNIMIRSEKDPNSQQNVTVCLENRDMLNTPYEDVVSFTSNECYGSEDVGFVLPYMPCNRLQYLITGNVAGGCLVGFFMVKLTKESARCLTCADVKAFNCKYGVLGNPDQVTTLIYNKLILTGNQEGLILRFSTKEKNNTAQVIGSYISAITDPDCSGCNQDAQSCSNSVGIRLLSVTETGSNKQGFNSTEIRSSSPIDAKTFVQKVEFAFFQSTYPTTLPINNCSNNFMFKAHDQAVDLVGSTYLHDCTQVESDNDSFAYFRPFETKFLGLEGGCGETNCTSLQNYFIEDMTGGVLGAKGNKLLPNNLYFSNKTLGCEFIENMNGHFCNSSEEVSVFAIESIAKDFNTRIIWPVNLISTGNDSINNSLNVEKQWSFRNGYPEGKRKARLTSLVKLNSTYNLTFFNRAPADMVFQIQEKSPGVEEFGWLKIVLEYPEENSIRIKANDVDKEPIILRDNRTQTNPTPSECGSYKYVYDRKYIEYILTTECRIRMSFVNSVKATIRLDQQVSDFFTNNGTAKFIDKMCAILNITDTSRLKIVGVYTGSTIVNFYVEEQHVTTEENSTTSTPTAAQSAAAVAELNQKLQEAVATGQLQTVFTSAGLGSVLQVSSTIVLVNETGVFQTDMSKIAEDQSALSSEESKGFFTGTTKIVIIIAGSGLGVLLILVGLVVYMKCIRQNTVENESVVEEIKGDVEIAEIDKSDKILSSFFDNRKALNLQNLKKKSKVKGEKSAMAQNNSMVSFKNPFDDNYMPKNSNQQFQEVDMVSKRIYRN